MRIRKVRNSAGNISVQIGHYKGKNFLLVKHLGSAKNKEELDLLIQKANEIINHNQLSIFSQSQELDVSQVVSARYSRKSIYIFFSQYYDLLFYSLDNKILKDLVIMRILKPTSKLESIELLYEYFGLKYSKTDIGRKILSFNKDNIIKCLIKYAQDNLDFDFRLVFYDVTTLYFESQPDENLKIPGFSKDGKHTQPQILIGLVVNEHGFPIYYDIFKGNSFEGHTMLPVIQAFQKSFNVENLTVIADSAMLSENNLLTMESSNLNYIVGNRTITTYKPKLDNLIKKLKTIDNSSIKIKDGERYIIYHYSLKREKKDLYEITKATHKAQYLSNNPSKQSRAKYLKVGSGKSVINYELIKKHKFLAGIKSYKTNTNLASDLIVERYSDLWKVEKAFRMSKHDLKARPIFHRKDEAIKAHILIVFVANALARVIELKTKKTIQKVVKEQMRVIDVELTDLTGQKHTLTITPH